MIQVRTLGPIDLTASDDRDLTAVLAQPKRLALLVYLAVAAPRGFLRRDTLLAMFWPESPEARARAALRQAVHFLRQRLGSGVLVNRGVDEIGLDLSALRIDALDFAEALGRGDSVAAVAMYGGGFLDGFAVPDAPAFEDWLARERDRLRREWIGGLDRLATDAEEAGATEAAVRWLRPLSTADRVDTRYAMRLADALEQSGDRLAALAHLRQHDEQVRNELGVEPDEAVRAALARLTAAAPAGPGPRPARRSTSRAAASGRRIARPTLVVGSLFVVAGVLLSGWWRPDASASAAASVMVIPFENHGAATDGYLAPGLTSGVVGRLGGLRGVRVSGPRPGRGLESRGGFRLGVNRETTGHVLRATVERVTAPSGRTTLRVVPVLTRTVDDRIVWETTLELDGSAIGSLEARIAVPVAEAMGIEPLRSERSLMAGRSTDDPDAYDAYLRGLDLLDRDVRDRGAMFAATATLARATGLDTTFAEAYAQLAIAHLSLHWWDHDRTSARLRLAEYAANRAISLRPDLPMSHLAQGWYFYWGHRDYGRALRHFELARAGWPALTDVLVLIGGVRRRQGDFNAALGAYTKAAEMNSACEVCFTETAFTYLLQRRFPDAERAVKRALAVAPEFRYARFVAAWLAFLDDRPRDARRFLASEAPSRPVLEPSLWRPLSRAIGGDPLLSRSEVPALATAADTARWYLTVAERMRMAGTDAHAHYDQARIRLEALVRRIPDDPVILRALALAYAGVGRGEEAIERARAAIRLRPPEADAIDGSSARVTLARVYMMTGRRQLARKELAALMDVPSVISKELLRRDPLWQPLGFRR